MNQLPKINVNIIPYHEKYLMEMVQLFVEVYSDTDYPWDIETAKTYLQRNIDSNPEYCYLAIDENARCLGEFLQE